MGQLSAAGDRTNLPAASAPAAGVNTLRLRWPFGQTLVQALFVFSLLFGFVEAAARSPVFQARLTAPSLGSRHRQFEIQWFRLETQRKSVRRIDCIFLGNSMVWQGFDPETFARAYYQRTGRDLACFNFGVDGLPAAAAGPLAQILIAEYRPRLLIYGTDARDYAVPVTAHDAAVILEMPWVRYRLGQLAPEGWLLDHSYFFRYRGHLQQVIRFDYEHALRMPSDLLNRSLNGFDPDDTVATYIDQPPDPASGQPGIQYYFGLLSDYELRPEGLAGLELVIDQAGNGTEVLVVEMPVPKAYMYFFGHGVQDYERFLAVVETATLSRGVTFLPTAARQIIPDEGWANYSHMNAGGAQIFSHWLGHELGKAAARGTLGALSADWQGAGAP